MLSSARVLNGIKWTVAALLFCYIVVKAVTIAITQDEAFSYFLVKTNNFKAMAATANTHWLNSISMKFWLSLPGSDSLWKIRMLSMLCWPLYCYSAIRLSGLLKNKLLGLTFFGVTVFNPFLIFYFSLARGYAASCAFIMLALWQAAKILNRPPESAHTDTLYNKGLKPARWLSVFIPAALAVAANFSSFYFFIALTFVYVGYLLLSTRIKFIAGRPFQAFNLLVALTAAFAVTDLFIIKYYGHDLEFGATSDLIGSVFGSLVVNSQGIAASADQYYTADEYYNVAPVYHTYGMIVFVLTAAALIYGIWHSRMLRKISIGSLAVFILCLVAILSLVFNLVFKTPFLIDRSSLMLYPIAVVALFFLGESITGNRKRGKVLAPFIAAGLLIACCFNFYRSYDTRYFKEWSIQSDTKEGLDYLQNADAKHVGMDLWHYSVFTNYYKPANPGRYKFNADMLQIKELLNLKDTRRLTGFDHLLLAPPFKDSSRILRGWELKQEYKLSKGRVLERKRKD